MSTTKTDKSFVAVWAGEVPPAATPAEPKVTAPEPADAPVVAEPANPNPFATVDPNLVQLAMVLMLKRLREMREEEGKS